MAKSKYWVKGCGALLLLCTAVVLPSNAFRPSAGVFQFKSLHEFIATDGAEPYNPLVQTADGNLYGTTNQGGDLNCISPYGCGTIFRIAPGGALTNLHNFESTDGLEPDAALIQATDGDLYGTTAEGGNGTCIPFGGCGTVFRFTSNSGLTTMHSFDGTDGELARGLVQGADRNLYGMTDEGGTGSNEECRDAANGCGTIFKMSLSGEFTTLHDFDGTDGAEAVGSLIQAADGNFYGVTNQGGHSNSKHCSPYWYEYTCGTVFKMTPGGKLTTIYAFCSQSNCVDGANPAVGLVHGSDGNFYGTTAAGGLADDGTVFRVTPEGKLTTLHSFTGTDGESPDGGLVQGTDGNFYGATVIGGTCCGTLYSIVSSGVFTTLFNFDGANGQGGKASPIQDTNGAFYGTTVVGGAADCPYGNTCGTLYAFSVGLWPFVKTNPAAGKVGAAVGILGTDLTGATGVKFNGTETAFRLVSSSFIEAKVPSGATTGKVTVQLPGGTTLSSNVPFIVLH